MKFKKALKAMKEGKTVSRYGLEKYSARLSDHDSPCFQRIIWSLGDWKDAGYVSVSDYDSKDWYIVEEGCGDNVPANENIQ